ncbi:hypothetical protein C8Q70DRAFT_972874 [Cubamyces menziesii]|nr:hypothetical protein C8Q70DRAFT_972874 [Cubamyces menziesii]
MPRLIPRLLRALDHARTRPPRITRRPSLPPLKPRNPRNFTRPEDVDISPHGRTKSILLDRAALRLIYRHSRYQRSKGIAPQVHISKTRWKAAQRRGCVPPGLPPREMTQEERSFYANPYLRMLGSPLRQCFHTGWLLPRQMLIRMTPMLFSQLASEKPKCAFLPSGLEHPAFTRFEGGRSSYLLCYKPVFDLVRETGAYRRFNPGDTQLITMHPLVTQQIGHLLRVRVLQELQLLARQILRRRRLAKPDEPPLLRRLTRAEWNDIKATGVIPHRNAVAVLVVPPPNRDPVTKSRPTPFASPSPPPDASVPKELPRTLPLSVLYPTAEEERRPSDVQLPDAVPPSCVPLYNGATLFPSPTQRAALHAALGQVLAAESTVRFMIRSRPALPPQESTDGRPVRAKGDQKASHAILVCSDEQTLLRGDTVPLAVALWRVRMWEGGLDDGVLPAWMAGPPLTA